MGTPDHGGVIRDGEAYTLEGFTERTGIGADGLRHLELEGLRVAFASRRKFITGREWIRFLESRLQSKGDERP